MSWCAIEFCVSSVCCFLFRLRWRFVVTVWGDLCRSCWYAIGGGVGILPIRLSSIGASFLVISISAMGAPMARFPCFLARCRPRLCSFGYCISFSGVVDYVRSARIDVVRLVFCSCFASGFAHPVCAGGASEVPYRYHLWLFWGLNAARYSLRRSGSSFVLCMFLQFPTPIEGFRL